MKLLTKTDFIRYRECPNNTWVKINEPEEYAKFEISDFEKSLGVMGNEVERLVRGMFPAGVLVDGRGSDAQELTKKLIAEKTPVIFQAICATNKYLAATDILVWNESANAYDVCEVKMSSAFEIKQEEMSDADSDEEDLKPKRVNKKKELQYEYDLAFQVNVFEMCGVRINNKYLIRLNKEYTKIGDLDFSENKLFVKEDKTEAINNLLEQAKFEMEQASELLSQNIKPTGNCFCYYKGRSSHCTAFKYINPEVPDYSVHDLNRIGNSKALLKELLDAKILTVENVPEDWIPAVKKLSAKDEEKGKKQSKPRKLNQVQAYKTKREIIDLEAIKTELNSLTFPLYFLDYETYPTAIPMFNGYRPYQHIVFQYSLHVLRSVDSELAHYELLVLDGDPAERIVEGLKSHIGDTGSIISWYKKFENSRNKELARLVPLHYEFLHDVISRTYDLMDIVDQQYYVHYGFKGSSSIKKVQPVLAPDFSYKHLDVQNGTDAIEAYRQITQGELTGELVEEKKKQMLEYCKNDTEVMYILWKFFLNLIK
ncbi:MAG: hypothetical protein UT20_C0033G0005 [Candidatus Levybacteria bacterium GW2011_GWA1_39_11]|nr:MAG: hypothetical protein UT20_C0033G0005 [Candidatus Levybacteria bacterium GW2011_GWA1_39_11]